MYYYEFYLDGRKKTYQSKFQYTEDEINEAARKLYADYKNASTFMNYPNPSEVMQHLAVTYGILPKPDRVTYECTVCFNTVSDSF